MTKQHPRVPATLPQHVAIIMDGNGRWAKAHFMPRVEGHRQGAKSVRCVVEETRRLNIPYLTLYSFSSENWRRPVDEVSALMRLFCQYLESEVATLRDNGVRLRVIGDLERLPGPVRELLSRVLDATAECSSLQLVLALSYGARDELTHAVRQIAGAVARGELTPGEIGPEHIRSNLYAPDIPDPDLLIRTSGELRISNFLLWQLAYTEIVVSQSLWPAFDAQEYRRCLEEYAQRERRFGLTGEQVSPPGAAE